MPQTKLINHFKQHIIKQTKGAIMPKKNVTKKLYRITFLSLSLLSVNAAYAENSTALSSKSSMSKKVSIGAKLGILGSGVDLSYGINNKINVRFNYNHVNFGVEDADSKTTDEDLKLTGGHLKLDTIGALVDYFPNKSKFRVSAGLYKNNNELSLKFLDSKAHDNIKIGDENYSFSKDAKTSILSNYKNLAPYLGIGWGNKLSAKSHWSFNLDAGVLYQGSTTTKMSLTGSGTDLDTGKTINLATDTTIQKEVKKDEAASNKELDSFKFLPNLSAGVSYRF